MGCEIPVMNEVSVGIQTLIMWAW